MPADPIEEPVVPDPRGPTGLLADRRFGPYVVSQWLSNTGNWFHNVAIGIVIFQITGSSTLVGIIGGLQYAFTLLLAPVAGTLSDRVDRRRLLIGAQITGLSGAVGLAALLAVVDLSPALVWPIAGLTCLIGIGYAIGLPTLQAFVPSLVPRVDLPQAIALNSVTFNLARAIGPALAGLVVAAAGAATAFGLNALSFVAFLLVLLWLGRGAAGPVEPPESGAGAGDRSPWAAIGLARQDRLVGTVMLATVGVGFATDPVLTLAPALAERSGGGAALVGAIGSAFGGGGTLASLGVAAVRRRVGPRTQATGGIAVLALGLLLGAFGTETPVLLAGMAIAGAGFLHAATTLNSTLQLHVDDSIRGRVMALWGVAFLGVRPVAAAMDGAIADLAGLTTSMLVSTVIALAAAAGLVMTRPPD